MNGPEEEQGAVEQPTTDDPIDQAAARFAKLGFDGAATELATKFKPEQYDRVRVALAKRLAIRVSTLDRAYEKARAKGDGEHQHGRGQPLEIRRSRALAGAGKRKLPC